MELKVIRRRLLPDRTIGDLYIDGNLFCQTMEDQVRPAGEKVPGKTAIPAGRYEVRLTYSARFRKVLPQLMRVPLFEGVRIHPGNGPADTEGCLLLGKEQGDIVAHSRDTFNDFIDLLELVKTEPVYITIKNKSA